MNKQTLTEESQPAPTPTWGPKLRCWHCLSLRAQRTGGPGRGKAQGWMIWRAGEGSQAPAREAGGPGLAEAVPSACPLFRGAWPAPFPLTLEVFGGGAAWPALASWGRWPGGQAGQGAAAVESDLPPTPPPRTHIWWGKGRVSQGHTCARHPYITHMATPSSRDTLTHSPCTHTCTRTHTRFCRMPSLLRVQTQAP